MPGTKHVEALGRKRIVQCHLEAATAYLAEAAQLEFLLRAASGHELQGVESWPQCIGEPCSVRELQVLLDTCVVEALQPDVVETAPVNGRVGFEEAVELVGQHRFWARVCPIKSYAKSTS